LTGVVEQAFSIGATSVDAIKLILASVTSYGRILLFGVGFQAVSTEIMWR
jgi:hypothetical protein